LKLTRGREDVFTGIREYGLIPLFTHLQILPSPLNDDSQTTSSPVSPHTHNFVPTLTSGIISGTLFSYFQRPNPPSISRHLKGGFTLGLGCLLVQSLVNEGDLLRIKLLQRSEERRKQQDNREASDSTPLLPTALQSDSPPLPSNRPSILSPLPNSAPSNSQHFSDPTSLTFSERSDLLFKNLWIKTKETLKSFAPLKRIEEGKFEELVQREQELKKRELEKVRQELKQLENQVEMRR